MPGLVAPAVDLSSKDSIIENYMPSWIQVRHELEKQKIKNVSNAVNIELFSMQTPYADRYLLKDTELVLESNKRLCLYGANSTGKTLLFSNMAQSKIKDFPKHIHTHHCKELEQDELDDTVLNTVVKADKYRNALLKVQSEINALLAEQGETLEKEKLDGVKENLNWVEFTLRQLKSDDAEERAKKMLRALGFDEEGQQKPVNALSGGLRMRVALCMAFFIEPQMLLLDEPTNHLDFPSVLWLENRLRGYKSSFLLVSHDRELLNNVCTGVLLLEDLKIKTYACGFKEFEKRKANDDKKKYTDIEKFLQRNRNPDPSTMLGKEVHDKRIWADNYHAKAVALQGKFTFPPAAKLQPQKDEEDVPAEEISLINLKNVRFSYDESKGHFIFNDPISFNVKAGTRVGVMGPNGAGKSTLLKLLTRKLTATSGEVVQHPKFSLAYFGQHSTAELDLEQTPIEFMKSQFQDMSTGHLRNHLAKTSIVGGVADTRMKGLSYSQRSCVIFAKLTLTSPHLLILDEPTNFLDLESVDSLIGACNKYAGALLLVSHNRDFLKKCAKQYLSVVPGRFLMFDDLKTAERSTYTFISEMEEGGSAGKDALASTPGGGTVHDSQRVGNNGAAANGSSSTNGAANGAAAAPANKLTFTLNEPVLAQWTDGQFYHATIKGVAGGKVNVLYTEYGNVAAVAPTQLKKLPAGTAAPAAPAPAAAKGGKAGAKGKGGKK